MPCATWNFSFFPHFGSSTPYYLQGPSSSSSPWALVSQGTLRFSFRETNQLTNQQGGEIGTRLDLGLCLSSTPSSHSLHTRLSPFSTTNRLQELLLNQWVADGWTMLCRVQGFDKQVSECVGWETRAYISYCPVHFQPFLQQALGNQGKTKRRRPTRHKQETTTQYFLIACPFSLVSKSGCVYYPFPSLSACLSDRLFVFGCQVFSPTLLVEKFLNCQIIVAQKWVTGTTRQLSKQN